MGDYPNIFEVIIHQQLKVSHVQGKHALPEYSIRERIAIIQGSTFIFHNNLAWISKHNILESSQIISRI